MGYTNNTYTVEYTVLYCGPNHSSCHKVVIWGWVKTTYREKYMTGMTEMSIHKIWLCSCVCVCLMAISVLYCPCCQYKIAQKHHPSSQKLSSINLGKIRRAGKEGLWSSTNILTVLSPIDMMIAGSLKPPSENSHNVSLFFVCLIYILWFVIWIHCNVLLVCDVLWCFVLIWPNNSYCLAPCGH